MMATVLPFPLARRAGYIRSQADCITVQERTREAENILNQQLGLQREALLRKSVDPTVVEAEIASLQQAILAEDRRLTYAPVRGAVRA